MLLLLLLSREWAVELRLLLWCGLVLPLRLRRLAAGVAVEGRVAARRRHHVRKRFVEGCPARDVLGWRAGARRCGARPVCCFSSVPMPMPMSVL